MSTGPQARARLERILPPGWLPYLLHLRPRAWPIVQDTTPRTLIQPGYTKPEKAKA